MEIAGSTISKASRESATTGNKLLTIDSRSNMQLNMFAWLGWLKATTGQEGSDSILLHLNACKNMLATFPLSLDE